MLTKFALISELLTINHNQYVVRVMIISKGEPIASGLAAAQTIEIAEDRARQRAVALIDSELNPNLDSPESWASPASSLGMETVNECKSKYNHDAKNGNDNSTLSKPTLKTDTNFSLTKTASESSLSNNYKFPSNREYSSSLLDQNTNSHGDILEKNKIAHKANQNLGTSDSDKCQDLIKKTNTEIKRLGWTEEQGKNYLLKTYGKKIRKHLTYEELTEFYHYLQSQ